MYEVIFLLVVASLWIIFATVQDLKKREIANWLNFSLIVFILGFRLFYCLFSKTNQGFSFFYQGLIGLGIFFLLGNFLYYGRMFAGGDAKLMIALGVVLPFSTNFSVNLQIFLLFFFIFLFIGASYGLIVSMVLSLKNFRKFKKEFLKRLKKNRKIIYVLMFLGLLLIILGFLETLLFILGFFIFILPYFYLYAKTIEEVCMVKTINTQKLTEGDWLYEDVKVRGKYIKAIWDGLTKEQIKQIRSKYKKIKIKEGIPFTPVFLISFAILIFLYYSGYLNFLTDFFGIFI